ncbi:MAG TPA: type II secretion system protein N [Usitatibacter sp.]|nr:type II secretion system protein N [Usitatibacter sp.]
MRLRTMVLAGIAAYLAFLAATVPATFVIARARAAAPGLQVTDEHGTLWSGHARAAIASPGAAVAFDRVEWAIEPRALAAGRIAFRVSATGNGIDARTTLARGWSTWSAGDTAARMDAALFPAFVPLAAAWRPEGVVTLDSSGMEWSDDGAMRGAFRVDWQAAAVAFSDVKPLGRYVVEVRGDGGPVSVNVTSPEGPLRIAGQGSIAQGRFSFSGEARGEGDQARALEPILGLMGARRPDGAHALQVTIQR